MPVGSCLGSEASSNSMGPCSHLESEAPLDIVITSSALNAADQFAFMQQTLLLQIFRVDADALSEANKEAASPGGSQQRANLVCPTCIAFSDQCCQAENGLELFREFQDINLQCYWDAKLSEAISNLRYQGYVCPGILILLCGQSALETLTDAWRRRLLISPPTCRMSQVGVSNGCIVKPILQTHTIALQDILCLILARLKQRGQVADMATLCSAVSRDWAGAGTASGKKSPDSLKETVHAALGQLIKARKVYYTGAKGYFLVVPGDSPSKANGLGTRLSHLRHSLRDKTPNIFNGNANEAPEQEVMPLTESALLQRDLSPSQRDNNVSLDQSLSNNYDGSMRSPSHDGSYSSPSSNSSPGSSGAERSFNLERSQSLRVSKKSIRSMSKGGSLRLSKKDALIFKEEDEDQVAEESSTTPAKEPSPNKNFERKNSFLGKLFSSKKKSSNQAIYAPILKKEARNQQSTRSPPPPQSPSPIWQAPAPGTEATPTSSSPMQKSQMRNGPNGNFVVYERSCGAMVDSVAVCSNNGDGHIYNQIASSQTNLYGQIGPKTTLPNPNAVYGTTYYNHDLYQTPPPPLPYRPQHPPPPPQNLYSATSHAASAPQSPPSARPRPKFANSPSSNVASPAFPIRNTNLRIESPASLYATSSSSDPSSGSSSGSTASGSGPSSIDSQLLRTPKSPPNAKRNTDGHARPVFDESLVVIEKSNQELEKTLGGANKTSSPQTTTNTTSNLRQTLQRLQLSRQPVDTIHNNRNLSQEVIYEVDSSCEDIPSHTQSNISRASSQSTIKPADSSSVAPSFPSISDLTLTDTTTNFKSLTAQKLMAGLSFNSIDTLIEVNAAAEARKNLNESTETVDFGVI